MIKDVEPLLKECEETLKELKGMGNMTVACYVQGFINSINKLPDAGQRPHGEWREKYQWQFKYYCSFCGSGADRKGRFCDCCGADMRKRGEAE